jgi:hypothetical protein
VTRSHYFHRGAESEPEDGWFRDQPEPSADNFADSEFEWLWSRSVQDSRLPHEVTDPAAVDMLDTHPWRVIASSHEAYITETINEELAAQAIARRRANPLKPRVLAPDDVAMLRNRHRHHGDGFRTLAVRYGFPVQTVRRAIIGETWASVTDPPPCAVRGQP